jgi:hypothetical protein
VPPFHGNISFNAQHSPNGAFFSFTCGNFGTRGGFGLQIGRPGNQNIYIGAKLGDRHSKAAVKCLPFFEGAPAADAAAAFLVEQVGPPEQHGRMTVQAYERSEIQRHYGWASDRWMTPDFEFVLYTPIVDIPDPTSADSGAVKAALLPAVVAELIVDNTAGKEAKTAFFAMGFPDQPGLHLDPAKLGFVHRNGYGVRVDDGGAGAFSFMRWTPQQGMEDINPRHLLGNVPGAGITVPAGEKRTLRIALGVYLGGTETLGIEGKYYYTRYYGGIDDVLAEALRRFDALRTAAIADDQKLLSSGLSANQQFLIAHSTRSYYGSTQLMDVGGLPFWIVNEGEYCMLNTLDLSVDHVFWELERNPWVVKNLLDNFVRYYSYHDQVRARGSNQLQPGGISFCHDMGVNNVFSPPGNSSYEIPNLNAACFSYMTGEQLCNWIIIATGYLLKTGDLEWARASRSTLEACLSSLINRGDEKAFPALDSSRCGPGGAEITTYDSLDHSLAQTRNNLYMVVKAWSAYQGLERVFQAMELPPLAERAASQASKIATALPSHAGADGVFPAVFESDNSGFASRILPAIEALVYPLEWDRLAGESGSAWRAQSEPMRAALKKHVVALLSDPQNRNLFPDGGLRLSSTSNNSWMSKIALVQHAARKLLRIDEDRALKHKLAAADAAHVKWETEGASAYWAMSDQMVNGAAAGSKYYPRCITTALWMG